MKILTNLLKVKSIDTIALVAVFCYLAIIGSVPIELFMTIITAVITYYFTKTTKKEE